MKWEWRKSINPISEMHGKWCMPSGKMYQKSRTNVANLNPEPLVDLIILRLNEFSGGHTKLGFKAFPEIICIRKTHMGNYFRNTKFIGFE